MKHLITVIFLLTSCIVFSQSNYSFNKEKWIKNVSDSTCANYRGCIDLKTIFSEVKGKTKKEVKDILGRPDFTSKDNNGILYYSYWINKRDTLKWYSRKHIKGPSISLYIKENRVFDIIRVHAED